MYSSESSVHSDSTNDFLENFDLDLIDLKELVKQQLNKEQEVEEDTYPEQPPNAQELQEIIKKLEYSIKKSRQERQYVISSLDQLNSSIQEISRQNMQEFMEKQLILGNKDKLITSLCTRNEELLFTLINLKKENRRLNQELLYQISITEIKDMGQLVQQLQNQLSNMSKKIMDDQVLKKIEELENKLDEKQLEIHNLEKINNQNNKVDKKIYPQITKKIKKLRKKSQSDDENNPNLSKTRQKKRINYKENRPEPTHIISDPEEIVEIQNRLESSGGNSQNNSLNSQNNDEYAKPNKKLTLKKQIKVSKVQYKNNRNMCLDAIEDFLQF